MTTTEYERQITEEHVDNQFGDITLVTLTFEAMPRDKQVKNGYEVRKGGVVVEVPFEDGSGSFVASWDLTAMNGAANAMSFFYGMVAALRG